VQVFDIGKIRNVITGIKPGSGMGSEIPAQPVLKRCDIWNSQMDFFENQTFHLDLYFQWIGKTEKNNSEVLAYLIADPYQAGRDGASLPVQDLKKAVNISVTKLNDGLRTALEKIPVPILLFEVTPSSKPAKYYGMSYVNCLIENYQLEIQERQVTIYFPDFTEELMYIAGKIDFSKRGKNADVNLRVLFDASKYFSGEKEIAEQAFYSEFSDNPRRAILKFIHKMHLELIGRLSKYNIRVCFVRHNFGDLAERFGGLHCMVKVVERSQF
jgi:hypothetical protein